MHFASLIQPLSFALVPLQSEGAAAVRGPAHGARKETEPHFGQGGQVGMATNAPGKVTGTPGAHK